MVSRAPTLPLLSLICVLALYLEQSNAEDPFGGGDDGGDDPFGGGDDGDEDPFGGGDDGGDNPWERFNWDAPHMITHYMGALSVFGSSWIVIEILRDPKKLGLCYHRILLGLSLFDLFSSFWFFIGNWAHSDDVGLFAKVHTRSCVASGFFIYMGSLCIPMYNVALATYFFLTVKHGWREPKVRRYFERFVHLPICLTGIAISIVAIPLDMYNSWYTYCYAVNAYPDRGNARQTAAFQWISWIIVFTSALLVSVLMILIYVYVKRVLNTSIKYSLAAAGSIEIESSSPSTLAGNEASYSSQILEKMNAKTRQVRNMAFLYSIPFYATWVVPNLWFIITRHIWFGRLDLRPSLKATFTMQVYLTTALPLQGFLNWMIYMLPRFQRVREQNPSWTLPRVLANVFGKIFRSRGDDLNNEESEEAANDNDNCDNDDDDDDDDNESMIGSMMESIYIHFERESNGNTTNNNLSDATTSTNEANNGNKEIAFDSYNSTEADPEEVIHA